MKHPPSAGADASTQPKAQDPIDWSQIWYPGPKRVFTRAELQRVGREPPSRTLVVVLLLNLALIVTDVLSLLPSAQWAFAAGLMCVGLAGALHQALALWHRPSRRALLWRSLALAGLLFAVLEAARFLEASAPWMSALKMVAVSLVIIWSIGAWFIAVYRSNHLAARLRELDERERAVDMARQLATAQIQPHFLFNSLASLQHWVQTKDDRAAPMLAALTGFLRATLPLFDRQSLRLGDEAEAASQYLAVMRHRLGERLQFSVDISADAAEVPMPPGVLLTLVENAVEHGVQPSLSGGHIAITARVADQVLTLEVSDTGAGLAPFAQDGIGLTNSRARLAAAFGAAASLQLLPQAADAADPAPPGTVARVCIPVSRAMSSSITAQTLP